MKCLLTYKYIKFWQKLRNIKSEYRNIQSFYNTYTELISLIHSKRLWTHNNSINPIVTKGRVSAGDGQAVKSSLPTWTNAKNSQLWTRAVLATAAISCCLSPSSKKWGRFWRKGSCLWVWGPMSAVPALKRRQETVSSSISAYTYSDTLVWTQNNSNKTGRAVVDGLSGCAPYRAQQDNIHERQKCTFCFPHSREKPVGVRKNECLGQLM